jgi:acetylornithine deacetylase/succinyl-diaminopimelate desuccinylase-like protein
MDVRDYIAPNAAAGLDADRIHAPNEYVDLSRLLRGAESIA